MIKLFLTGCDKSSIYLNTRQVIYVDSENQLQKVIDMVGPNVLQKESRTKATIARGALGDLLYRLGDGCECTIGDSGEVMGGYETLLYYQALALSYAGQQKIGNTLNYTKFEFGLLLSLLTSPMNIGRFSSPKLTSAILAKVIMGLSINYKKDVCVLVGRDLQYVLRGGEPLLRKAIMKAYYGLSGVCRIGSPMGLGRVYPIVCDWTKAVLTSMKWECIICIGEPDTNTNLTLHQVKSKAWYMLNPGNINVEYKRTIHEFFGAEVLTV